MINAQSHRDGLPKIDVRLRMAALWASTMFLFVYVDLFSLYRPDVRQGLEDGTVGGFEVGQTFLLGVTLYVTVPCLMISLALILPRQINRAVSIVFAAFYAITIAGAAIGEWSYWLVGSAIEVVLLSLVIHHAWTWRAQAELKQP
ncbi:MAG: hypothetical protein HQ468_01590 [Actinomycetales bacterium]|nr:hypothetical protein [Actinomycetales bacterium]